MEAKHKEEIHQRLTKQMKDKGTSQAEASRQMSMSEATLSQIRNKNWENISDEMWLKAAKWCHYNFTGWRTRGTSQVTTIGNLLCDAQENCRMLALSAPTGLGKTTGIGHYHKHNRNVYVVLCTVLMSRRDFLIAIQEALGISVEGNLNTRMGSIIHKLASESFPLLILDDAGKLSDHCLRLVQIIYDELDSRAGIVLAGTPHMKTRIRKSAAKDTLGFRELLRRIGYWETLMPISRSTVQIFCTDDFGIRDTDVIEFVFKNCKDYGTLKELLINAKKLAEKEKCSITLDIISSVHVGDVEDKYKAAS